MTLLLDDLERHNVALGADLLTSVEGGVFWIHLPFVPPFFEIPLFPYLPFRQYA